MKEIALPSLLSLAILTFILVLPQILEVGERNHTIVALWPVAP